MKKLLVALAAMSAQSVLACEVDVAGWYSNLLRKPFYVEQINCDRAVLTDANKGIAYEFVFDGKTRIPLPQDYIKFINTRVGGMIRFGSYVTKIDRTTYPHRRTIRTTLSMQVALTPKVIAEVEADVLTMSFPSSHELHSSIVGFDVKDIQGVSGVEKKAAITSANILLKPLAFLLNAYLYDMNMMTLKDQARK